MDDNKDAVQDMEDILAETAEASQSADIATEVADESPAETSEESESTGSKRLDKAVKDRPNLNLDRILDRMRSRDDILDSPEPPSQNQQYQPIQYTDGEYTPTQLEQDRQAYAELQRQTGVRQGASQMLSQYKLDRFADNLELDMERVAMAHPELDPTSDEADLDRIDRLNRMYYNYIGYNDKKGSVARTDVRYKTFIDGMMALADDIASTRSSETAKNVARQASRTGVRPNGGSNRAPALTTADAVAKLSREDFAKNRDRLNEIALKMLANEA